MFESVLLPGAVLAEQRVHLARGSLEVDAVVRDDAREPLRDPAHARRRSRARRPACRLRQSGRSAGSRASPV